MIERLLTLNRTFYTTFADQFANSRSVADPALTSILPYLPSRARILDVGCGNGRLAVLLDEERPGCTYMGVDAVSALIEEAREQAGALTRTEATFLQLDVTEKGWAEAVPVLPVAGEGSRGYDRGVALAVLHHIPDVGLRARVLGDVAGLLAPEGYLVVSTWRFLAHPRMRRKIVEWDAVGVDAEQLDAGDYARLEARRARPPVLPHGRRGGAGGVGGDQRPGGAGDVPCRRPGGGPEPLRDPLSPILSQDFPHDFAVALIGTGRIGLLLLRGPGSGTQERTNTAASAGLKQAEALGRSTNAP